MKILINQDFLAKNSLFRKQLLFLRIIEFLKTYYNNKLKFFEICLLLKCE